MANIIKEIPTLLGKSSKRFNRDVAVQMKNKISPEEKAKMLNIVNMVKAKQKLKN